MSFNSICWLARQDQLNCRVCYNQKIADVWGFVFGICFDLPPQNKPVTGFCQPFADLADVQGNFWELSMC